jgi:hypothetical protein
LLSLKYDFHELENIPAKPITGHKSISLFAILSDISQYNDELSSLFSNANKNCIPMFDRIRCLFSVSMASEQPERQSQYVPVPRASLPTLFFELAQSRKSPRHMASPQVEQSSRACRVESEILFGVYLVRIVRVIPRPEMTQIPQKVPAPLEKYLSNKQTEWL